MNFRLIITLSLFGLIMGFCTICLIPSKAEPFYWLIIFILCAYIIAQYAPGKYFLHGLLVSLFNSVWITTIHIIFFSAYFLNHLQEAEMMNNSPLPDSPRLMMFLTGPIIGLLSGIILGLFSVITSRIINKKEDF